tara:strand:- start:433 stop:747 length:315 start_codon:yes stop_codon:yes gene_type:complete
MRPPPRDAKIQLLPHEEDDYDEASYQANFRSTDSGSGISAPSFIVEQRHNMPYEKQLSSMEKHQQERIKAKKKIKLNYVVLTVFKVMKELLLLVLLCPPINYLN